MLLGQFSGYLFYLRMSYGFPILPQIKLCSEGIDATGYIARGDLHTKNVSYMRRKVVDIESIF